MPEGDILENDRGQRIILRGGQWVPLDQAPPASPGVIYGKPRAPDPGQEARQVRADARDETRLQLDLAKREAEEAEAREKAEAAEAARRSQGVMMRDTLNRAERQIGDTSRVNLGVIQSPWINGQTGTLGAVSSLMPGTQAYDLRRTIDTLKANLSFDKLAEMRANSPTGGALGSITERELELLGSTVASLDQGQSEPELRRSLALVGELYNKLAPPPQAAPAISEPEAAEQRRRARSDAQRIRSSGPSDEDIARLSAAGPAAAPALAAALAQRRGSRRESANAQMRERSAANRAPPRPKGVPPDARWDAKNRQWVK